MQATPENLTATQPLPPDPTPANHSSQSIFPVLQNALQATIIGRVRMDLKNYDLLRFSVLLRNLVELLLLLQESILTAMRQVTDSTGAAINAS